jgi:glycosyltransferase involved in cell wall biosynthesis
VVDNGSSDATVEVARRYPVEICNCPERGIGPPRNLGVKMAKGDIVCFTDSDCIVEKDWLEKIRGFFERYPRADGVGGPVLPYRHGQNKVQKLTGEIFLEDHGFPSEVKRVRFGSMSGMIFGSNSAYKKDAIVSAGGYTEPGGSNVELAWRLVSMGRNLFFDPEMKVSHIFPSDLKAIFKQQFRWGAQMTHMMRIHHLCNVPKEIVLISYFLARRLLSLASPKNSERRLLQFTQLASYSLGRIYGLRF